MLSCQFLDNQFGRQDMSGSQLSTDSIFFFFKTVLYALYLDLSEVFCAILVMRSSLKQTGKSHSPDGTFQRKMRDAQGNCMWSMADTQK